MNNKGRIAIMQIMILLVGFIAVVYSIDMTAGYTTRQIIGSQTDTSENPDPIGGGPSLEDENTPSPTVDELSNTPDPSESGLFDKAKEMGQFLFLLFGGGGGGGDDKDDNGKKDKDPKGNGKDDKWEGFEGAIVENAGYALMAYMAGSMVAGVFGYSEPEQTNAISSALGWGVFVGTTVADIPGAGTSAGWIAGIGTGLLVLDYLWKDVDETLVKFQCHPWEAPAGGEDCEECNSDLYPCSEYRCKSLGLGCQLLNKGTKEEKCAWVNQNDVKSPMIEAWEEALTHGYAYTPSDIVRPPHRGFKITKKEGGCVKAFEAIQFGITLDEPAQCKIDKNISLGRNSSYQGMDYYVGGSSAYKYNHTVILRLPGPTNVEAQYPEIDVGNTYNFYIKCKDANGNVNEDLFVVNFCVESGPDVQPPIIEATSIKDGWPIQYGLNQTPITLYLNEPSECRWSKNNMDYGQMENNMSCSTDLRQADSLMMYECASTLTGLKDRKDNTFYFRCKDQPINVKEADRNTNTESYILTLKGTEPLNIIDYGPNGTMKGYGTLASVDLEVETSAGTHLGDSTCYYSETGENGTYVEFLETGTNKHEQTLELGEGEHTYHLRCIDDGGNIDEVETNFNVMIDAEPPEVVRVYQESGKLKLVTDEKAVCTYQTNKDTECNFALEEGTNMPYANSTDHYTEWKKGKNYYIKCKDEIGKQPVPDKCSIIVIPH